MCVLPKWLCMCVCMYVCRLLIATLQHWLTIQETSRQLRSCNCTFKEFWVWDWSVEPTTEENFPLVISRTGFLVTFFTQITAKCDLYDLYALFPVQHKRFSIEKWRIFAEWLTGSPSVCYTSLAACNEGSQVTCKSIAL